MHASMFYESVRFAPNESPGRPYIIKGHFKDDTVNLYLNNEDAADLVYSLKVLMEGRNVES